MAAIDTGIFDQITPKLHAVGLGDSFGSTNIVSINAKKKPVLPAGADGGTRTRTPISDSRF
jgi:hypothetical protein